MGGNVNVELRVSCKDGTPIKDDGAQNYYCSDNPQDSSARTKPLAAFHINGENVYVNTLVFGPTEGAWNIPKKLTIKGIDNTRKSQQGFETLKVFLKVTKATG